MSNTLLKRFELSVRSETYDYRSPMKFGGRIVTDVTIVSVDCRVESYAGQATGLGSMTMGVAWAWPSTTLDDGRKLALVIELCHGLADAYNAFSASGRSHDRHPLDVCHEMSATRDRIAAEISRAHGLSESIPALAVLLAASPIEAALFDAHGKAAGVSSYSLLSPPHLQHDMAHYLSDPQYRGVYLGDLISPTPADSMPLYHLVGALDPLVEEDVETAVGDGQPETLREWILRDGLTHLKIKLNGDDANWDTQRIVRTYQTATAARAGEWAFSLDFNERCANEDYVLSVLDEVSRLQPDAMRLIQYVEQPTHRDLERHPTITMHRAGARLPVVIDESLVDLKSLRTAVSQGYTGIALKACKGHAEALLLGAVARHEKLFLCVQDLTCVGASLLHSASLAAHIPGVMAIESNGRQYAPLANERWLERFADFFEVRNGRVPTHLLSGPGLGYGDDPLITSPTPE